MSTNSNRNKRPVLVSLAVHREMRFLAAELEISLTQMAETAMREYVIRENKKLEDQDRLRVPTSMLDSVNEAIATDEAIAD